jgi:dihydrofolate reductase
MIIIGAMSKDRIIGKGAGMPWNVPDEYQQYLDFVSGNTIILGRKSYEIFGADLPDGTSVIVISRTADFDGVTVVPSLAEALTRA